MSHVMHSCMQQPLSLQPVAIFCHVLLFHAGAVGVAGQGRPDDGELIGRWVRVLGGGGEGRRVRVWGRLTNFTHAPTSTNHSYAAFYGIPYAMEPLGTLRFQRPKLRPLEEDFEALSPPPPCPQLSRREGLLLGNESCLFLNVYMPLGGVGRGKSPVLVWLHGESADADRGGFLEPLTSGSAMELNPRVFMRGGGGVVVVTPQYRLGSLGFLSTVNEDLSGNVGAFDALLSLEWTQSYIPYFGGDETQVTLMGGKGGAIIAGHLATANPQLVGGGLLFHRVILSGGSPLSPIAIDPAPKLGFAEIALQNSCPPYPTTTFKGRHFGRSRLPLPVVQKESDARFLPPLIFRRPSETLEEGTVAAGGFNPVPIIIGVSGAEMQGYLASIAGQGQSSLKIFKGEDVLSNFIRSILSRDYGAEAAELLGKLVAFEYFAGLNVSERVEQAKDLMEEMLSDYLFFIPALSLAKAWSKHAPVYLYVFEHVVPSSDGPSGPTHGSDLEFLMGGGGGGGSSEIHSIFTQLLTSFIHKGSPLDVGVGWPTWREPLGAYLHITDQLQSSSGFRERQFQFWTKILPAVGGCGKSSSPFRKNRKGPLMIYKDVSEADASKQFYIYGSSIQ